MLFLSISLIVSWLIYKKCKEMSDPSRRIPTRRDKVIAESSLVLDGVDLEMRKHEYIKRKRGLKYPPTGFIENQATMPHTPNDNSMAQIDELMSVSDSSYNKAPRAGDFVFPVQHGKDANTRGL